MDGSNCGQRLLPLREVCRGVELAEKATLVLLTKLQMASCIPVPWGCKQDWTAQGPRPTSSTARERVTESQL